MGDESFYHFTQNHGSSIHIVDADLATCEALCVLFGVEGFRTSFSLDGRHFTAGLARRRPDLVVMNLRIGEESGLSLLRRLRATRAGTPVVMLSDLPQFDAAVAAMKLGAADVVVKPLDSDHLLAVVRETLGQLADLAGPRDMRGRPVQVRGFSHLTPREREVLELISNGQSNKEAGRKLGISPRTVEVHRARVMEKLGARNTADLMRIVLTS